MADKGLVQYPYSTREVVNVVKHLEVSIVGFKIIVRMLFSIINTF